jgi:hypothetical protein
LGFLICVRDTTAQSPYLCRPDERDHTHEAANILIEEGHPNARQIDEILSKGIGNPDAFLNLRTQGFGNKKENSILQAADCLAYGSCQQVASGDSKMLRILSDGAPGKFKLLECNEEVVNAVRSGIEANLQRLRDLRKKAEDV